MSTPVIEKVVAELLDELSTMCDLDVDTVKALKPGFVKVIEKNIGSFGAAPAGEKKVKGKGTRGAGKKATPKSDKIPHKNGYHFFVADKMGQVKEQGVGAKERMKTIGEMWKLLSEDDRKPFKGKAQLFNDAVDGEMKNEGWIARRDSIVEAANIGAGCQPKKPVTKTPKAPKEAAKAEPVAEPEEEEVEEAEEVKPAPKVEAKPAPKAEPKAAPVRKTTKKL
jgi:hypothetical protein